MSLSEHVLTSSPLKLSLLLVKVTTCDYILIDELLSSSDSCHVCVLLGLPGWRSLRYDSEQCRYWRAFRDRYKCDSSSSASLSHSVFSFSNKCARVKKSSETALEDGSLSICGTLTCCVCFLTGVRFLTFFTLMESELGTRKNRETNDIQSYWRLGALKLKRNNDTILEKQLAKKLASSS